MSEVWGETRRVRGGAGDDDAFVALRHRSGQTSQIWASEVAPAPGPRLRLIGSRGAFVVDGLDGQEEALRAGRRPGRDEPWGAEPRERWGRIVRGEEAEPVEPEPGAWPELYARLAAALRGDGPLPVDPRDAVAVARLLDQVP